MTKYEANGQNGLNINHKSSHSIACSHKISLMKGDKLCRKFYTECVFVLVMKTI